MAKKYVTNASQLKLSAWRPLHDVLLQNFSLDIFAFLCYN